MVMCSFFVTRRWKQIFLLIPEEDFGCETSRERTLVLSGISILISQADGIVHRLPSFRPLAPLSIRVVPVVPAIHFSEYLVRVKERWRGTHQPGDDILSASFRGLHQVRISSSKPNSPSHH